MQFLKYKLCFLTIRSVFVVLFNTSFMACSKNTESKFCHISSNLFPSILLKIFVYAECTEHMHHVESWVIGQGIKHDVMAQVQETRNVITQM